MRGTEHWGLFEEVLGDHREELAGVGGRIGIDHGSLAGIEGDPQFVEFILEECGPSLASISRHGRSAVGDPIKHVQGMSELVQHHISSLSAA